MAPKLRWDLAPVFSWLALLTFCGIAWWALREPKAAPVIPVKRGNSDGNDESA